MKTEREREEKERKEREREKERQREEKERRREIFYLPMAGMVSTVLIRNFSNIVVFPSIEY